MKKRTNLTLEPEILAKAQELMGLLSHGELSGFVEQLIREEYERRHGQLSLREKPGEQATQPASKPVRYPPLRTTAKK